MAGGKEKSTCTADHYQVVVHVDEKALRGAPDENSKSDLPIETVRRLCGDRAVVTVTEDEKGEPLNVGRKHRVVQPSLRRALMSRDRCCRFPGCTHERWLDAHHVGWPPRNIGPMEEKPASPTQLCSARRIIGFYMRVDSASRRTATAIGGSAIIESKPLHLNGGVRWTQIFCSLTEYPDSYLSGSAILNGEHADTGGGGLA
jgi:hypothetical protein